MLGDSFETPALIAATALIAPLMLYVAVNDVRELRIPNWAVLTTFAIFVVVGPFGLPFETYLWRLGYAVITLVVGFGLYSVAQGKIGGGDLKLLAALAPFLSGANFGTFAIIYVLLSVVGLIAFFVARTLVDRKTTRWKALAQGIYFPAGVLIGLAVAIVLAVELYQRVVPAVPAA